ncbi:hypothetical protein BHYA_1205g00010 [Botrytis hyacinthi]|uniref:Uncharacterized protein n=1 Tax=Botrytis hyacinthi TaxID=278943 RepID=A0A4Z1GBG1_9HELO|nr:hypothetical protein BHYA_1205g00010 [Botrytis hyacinthi]
MGVGAGETAAKPQKLTVENVERLARQENEEMEIAAKLDFGIGNGHASANQKLKQNGHGETGKTGKGSGRALSVLRGDSMEVLGDTLMGDSSREASSGGGTQTPSSMPIADSRVFESPGVMESGVVGDYLGAKRGEGNENENAEERKDSKDSKSSRPSVGRRWMDSEVTVRGSPAEES